jgi:hypothetical protein
MTNAELQELYGEQDLVALIKMARLRWLEHVERMEDKEVPKRMLDRPGRRRKTPVEVVRRCGEDLREIGVRRWRTKAVDRNECLRTLEEA